MLRGMAGGMGRRHGPTLADRLAASGRSTPPAAPPDAPADSEGRRERPVAVRHCWVTGLPGAPGRHPGLLAEWRHDAGSGAWHGRVVYAVDEHGRIVLVERWVPAEHLSPA